MNVVKKINNKNKKIKNKYDLILSEFIQCDDVKNIIIDFIMDLYYFERFQTIINNFNDTVLIYTGGESYWTGKYHLIPRSIIENYYNFRLFLKFSFPFFTSNFDCNYFIKVLCECAKNTRPKFVQISYFNIFLDELNFDML